MPTERQKRVAKKLSENVRNKKLKNKGEILLESDYSESSSKKPDRVLKSKGVQQELKPFVEQLEKERQRLLSNIVEKNLDKVSYDKAVNSLDTLTKNIRLLSGKETDKVAIVLPSSLIKKNKKE